MLNVVTPQEALAIIEREFSPLDRDCQYISPASAAGRVLALDVASSQYVPDFDRSTVDGYALRAADTFGCSDAIPAILRQDGEVLMGVPAGAELADGECRAVPTGGALPPGADCCVMVEYTESYGDGTIGVMRPAAPGENVIFRGDDVYPGKRVLCRGRRLTAPDIGALAAMGVVRVPVTPRLKVGIMSTGDELVEPSVTPGPGQVRDVNSAMLSALVSEAGGEPVTYGIIRDDREMLRRAVETAAGECELVLLSGGSSVGEKDAAHMVIDSLGEVLFHGIAMKPGKPALLGGVAGVPVLGLPGHPAAAYFTASLFALPLMARLEGRKTRCLTVPAELTENVGANGGRAVCLSVYLEERDGRLTAKPIRGKSGLISALAGADGYFVIGRDCEGLPKGAVVRVVPGSHDQGGAAWLFNT